MLRTLILSMLLLVSIGVMLPYDGSTHGIRSSVSSGRHRHYRRHSRAWWRRYRARLRHRRAAALAAHRNVPLNPILPTAPGLVDPVVAAMPTGWNKTAPNSNEMRFRTDAASQNVPGQVSLSVVALSRPSPAYVTAREQSRMLAGINVTDLRRIVIDKMIVSNGWVTNDFVRDVNGQRVFIVTAQTPADGRSSEKSWSFYFTEINGRVYSITTNTPPQFSDRMAFEAERFIESLRARGVSPQTNR